MDVPFSDFHPEFSALNESHVPDVDISKPVVLAEIAQGRYNLIDGYHRMTKARRLGVEKIPAYKLYVHQHIVFMTNKRDYLAYVEYWNEKLKAE